jgi:hypothetical protein
MTPLLIRIQPFDVEAAARIDVFVASALEGDAYGLGGVAWAPALVERPQLSFETMSLDVSGRVQTGRARFSISLAAAKVTLLRKIKWGGARVRIFNAKTLAWPSPIEFDGEIVDHNYDLSTGLLTITAEVSTSLIEKPLLTLEFDGSGGAGGEPSLRGTLKPAGFGQCENIPPVMFDTVRNIGMIDGYGNCTAITRLMEGASDMGPVVDDYATYAELAAAIDSNEIPPGRWGTCVAEGLIGLGAPPVGVIGVNATFGSDRLGSMMQRILVTHADVPLAQIETTSFSALDTALNFPTRHWTDQQVDCKTLLEVMARSGNATLLITAQRQIAVSRAVASAPVATIDGSGAQIPRCLELKALAPVRPVWRLKARCARPANVLSTDEVNYVDDIIDRGAYNAATVYRAGNTVTLPDKSEWLYINETAAAGNAPPTWPTTSNAFWSNRVPPIDGDVIGGMVAPANANRVPFSRMEGDRGWQLLFNPVPLVAPVDFSAAFGLRFVRASAVATAAGQSISIGQSGPAFPVRPGERLSVQARVELSGTAGEGGTWQLEFWTFQPDGVTQSSIVVASGVGPNSISSNIVNAFVDVPAGRVFGRLELRAVSAGAGTMPLLIAEPMVTSAAPGQTVHPSFSPGPNASDGADPNSLITIGPDGEIDGIGPGNGTPVDNGNVVLEGVESARPGGGLFIGQLYSATDTGEVTRWNGTSWEPSSDITTTSVRIIEPQFPVIEIKQGEAGNVGNRTVTHVAKRGTATLTGGTWSITSQNLGASPPYATIVGSTGTVTLSGILISGAYVVRYTHTDGITTDLPVNVTYLPTPGGGTVTQLKTGFVTSNAGTANNNNWQQIASLTLQGAQAGTASLDSFTGSSLNVNTATGTADFEARLLVNGVETVLLESQNVVTGGVLSFADFSGLFIDAQPTPAGNVTFAIQLRRTSGSGVITSTTTRLEATIFAS